MYKRFRPWGSDMKRLLPALLLLAGCATAPPPEAFQPGCATRKLTAAEEMQVAAVAFDEGPRAAQAFRAKVACPDQ